MDRKYRQQGYQDDGTRENERAPQANENNRDRGPRRGYGPREPPKMNMPGFFEVKNCGRCGNKINEAVVHDSQCKQCGNDLQSCSQCTWFDTGNRFECGQPITERISPKDVRNNCKFFEVRVTVERATHSTGTSRTSKQEFDDLFK